jgi:hypothetical protein
VHKADIVLVVLAMVALGVTGLGAAKSDDWTGERTYTFSAGTSELAAQGPTPVGSSPTRFEWPAPTNATSLVLNVTVSFTGQAVRGGSAVLRVTGIAPDGTSLPVQTRGLTIGQGATSASVSFDYEARWMEQPTKVRDTQAPMAQVWSDPIVVLVTVERPGDLPAASYAFTATLAGDVMGFASA